MRVGGNPEKRSGPLGGYGRHRIIMPVYVPHHDGYYRHALETTGMCLESLHLTTAGRAAITVIANGCAADVVEALRGHFAEGWFDQLLLNETNRGKVDAIASAARGCFEPFITISDNDVLFRPGWLRAVEETFEAFPEAGAVCPFPCPTLMWHHTSSTIIGSVLRREARFLKVADDLALDRLAQSFGQQDYVKPELRKAQLVVQRGGRTACVGATHIVCTMRRAVLGGMPSEPSLRAISGESEVTWFDLPNDRLAYWRLSTPDAWASHMGNTPEPWMTEELAGLVAAHDNREDASPLKLGVGKPSWLRLVPLGVRRKVVEQLQRPGLRRRFFRSLGYSPADWPAAADEAGGMTHTA